LHIAEPSIIPKNVKKNGWTLPLQQCYGNDGFTEKANTFFPFIIDIKIRI